MRADQADVGGEIDKCGLANVLVVELPIGDTDTADRPCGHVGRLHLGTGPQVVGLNGIGPVQGDGGKASAVPPPSNRNRSAHWADGGGGQPPSRVYGPSRAQRSTSLPVKSIEVRFSSASRVAKMRPLRYQIPGSSVMGWPGKIP
jgi:hypothetical protein